MPVLLPLVPLSQFGRRFFLLVSMISIAFVGLAITAGELAIGHLYLVFAALLIAYNLFLPRQRGVDWSERREEQEGGAHPVLTRIVQALLVIAIPVGVLALVVDALRYTDTVELEFASELLLALNFVSAAVLLGGALAAMILGHWYLVSRKLSFTLPVKRRLRVRNRVSSLRLPLRCRLNRVLSSSTTRCVSHAVLPRTRRVGTGTTAPKRVATTGLRTSSPAKRARDRSQRQHLNAR